MHTMKVLIACECSGVVREAFRKRGHDAWSCDFLPAEDDSPFHFKCDVLTILDRGWDLMVAHPPCTRLANSGVRWLKVPPPGKTLKQMWKEFQDGADFYRAIQNAPIKRKAIENPIMHRYAKWRILIPFRQVVQPWWFGHPSFKATGFELYELPQLTPTHKLVPPQIGTLEHKQWSVVHHAPPRT